MGSSLLLTNEEYNNRKIRARIVLIDGFYRGEIYGTWETSILGIYPISSSTEWKQVTRKHLTKIGALKELKKWKEEKFPKEFLL